MKFKEHFLLGQNYDFYYGHGLIVVSPRGLSKFSLSDKEEGRLHWVSKYGNVTFTQFGRELPMSGMNENGLAIAMMFHRTISHLTQIKTMSELLRLAINQ